MFKQKKTKLDVICMKAAMPSFASKNQCVITLERTPLQDMKMTFYSLLLKNLCSNTGNKYFYHYQVYLAYNCITLKSNQLQNIIIWPSVLTVK